MILTKLQILGRNSWLLMVWPKLAFAAGLAVMLPPQPGESAESTVDRTLIAQVSQCWVAPANMPEGVAVHIVAGYKADGSLDTVGINPQDEPMMESSAPFRALSTSAIEALRACSPLPPMPHYSPMLWQRVEMTFTAKEMLVQPAY